MGVHPWPGPGWDPLGDLAVIKADRVRATYRNGVLDIRLPTRVESQPRRVPIEAT